MPVFKVVFEKLGGEEKNEGGSKHQAPDIKFSKIIAILIFGID